MHILVSCNQQLIILIINKFIVKFSKNEKSLYKLGILNMIALMVHNFPEGIASFMSSYADISLGIKIAVALMLHNIPEDCFFYASPNKI